MTSRQPHHFTAREHENGSRPHAVLLIHLSLSGGKERGRSVVHEACRRKLVEYHVFRALRPKLNASARAVMCSFPKYLLYTFFALFLLKEYIYMQIHKLAPLAHEFPKEVMTSNIMLPSCTTYTRKCVPGEKGFGSEHPHQSDGSYRCTHALVELSCRFRATRAVGGKGVWMAH